MSGAVLTPAARAELLRMMRRQRNSELHRRLYERAGKWLRDLEGRRILT